MVINKMRDVSACGDHGADTYRKELSFELYWDDGTIELTVVDICNHCGIVVGVPYILRFTRSWGYV